MKNDELSKISKELLSGAKMLSKHCKTCNFPLFQKNGIEYCPNCKDDTSDIVSKNELNSLNLKNVNHNKVIEDKISFLCNLLEKETDLDKIYKISNLISELLELSQKLNDFQKIEIKK
ncbi:Sjogren's syndrome/scleroderma autoantigen 1 family protein [Methanococcus voltae]